MFGLLLYFTCLCTVLGTEILNPLSMLVPSPPPPLYPLHPFSITSEHLGKLGPFGRGLHIIM